MVDQLLAAVNSAPERTIIINVQGDQTFLAPALIIAIATSFITRQPALEVQPPACPAHPDDAAIRRSRYGPHPAAGIARPPAADGQLIDQAKPLGGSCSLAESAAASLKKTSPSCSHGSPCGAG